MKSFKLFLKEFTELPIVYSQKTANVKTNDGIKQVPYSDLVKLNAISREKRNKNITYEDDKRYNDHEGRLWLNVKQKDKTTIYIAAITGMIDANRFGMKQVQINSLNDLATLKNVFAQYPNARALAEDIWDFLSQYMGKGTVHVYRGLDLSNKIFYLLAMDRRILYSPERILQYVDNTTKEFNSFSVNKFVSKGFADNYTSIASLVYSADVDNNDINWAFTAYLFGRHGGTGESELNINNLKKLKNIKIEAINIDKALQRKAAIDRTAKFNERHPQMKCSVGKELIKGKYEVTNIETNLKTITDDDCNILCKTWLKKIAVRTTDDTYEVYFHVMNAEDQMNLFDLDLHPLLHDWYYSLIRLKDSDFALVGKTRPTRKLGETKYNIINLRTRDEVVPEDFISLSHSMYMNNHSYAVIAVEPNRKCIVDLNAGKYMTDAIYSDIVTSYKNGFVMHRTDGAFDIFDSNCKTIVDKVNWQEACSTNLVKVLKNNMVNIVNMATGKLIIPKWVSAKSSIQVVTLDDINGTFKHQKPGIYITQQKFNEFGDISSLEQIYVDFNGKAQIVEDNPFED